MNVAAHVRRWARKSGEWLASYRGEPIRDIGKALDGACERAGVERITPHAWKHTAITWFFQNGGSIEDAADYFATTTQTIERVYRQHSPHYQDRAARVMQRPNPETTRKPRKLTRTERD